MTLQVNIAKAKAILSELVARAEAGEQVVLMRNGTPVATIAPTAPKRGARKLGAWSHLRDVMDPDSFVGSDPEVEAAAEDSLIFPDEV